MIRNETAVHPPDSTPGFHGLGIAPRLLEIIGRLQFTEPTPIQTQAIPPAIQGKDLVGIAQTGTGKTLAFGVPMIQRLAEVGGQGLVVLPTRELALQVDEVFQQVGRSLNLRTVVLIGGTGLGLQKEKLRRKPHVVIATPGRLLDHLEQKNLTLQHVRIAVFDEADRMLDMGFMPQVRRILAALPRERQTMLFSATMPGDIFRIAQSEMKLPIRVEIAPTGTTAERVTQELFIVAKPQKTNLLVKLLGTHVGSTLVFSRTKHGAKKLTRMVKAAGFSAAEIHSNRSLNQRREALDGFKSGKYRVLIATDIAARGIDVVGIELVVNFDLPSTSEDYVHRIGRTARASASGHAVSFAEPNQQSEVRAIERLTRRQIPISPLPDLPAVSHERYVQEPSFRGRSRGGPSGPRRFSSRPGGGFGQRASRPGHGQGQRHQGRGRGRNPGSDRYRQGEHRRLPSDPKLPADQPFNF